LEDIAGLGAGEKEEERSEARGGARSQGLWQG